SARAPPRRGPPPRPPRRRAGRRVGGAPPPPLFDRSHRRIRLTAAGALLWDEARELLAREDRLRMLARRAGDGGLGTLRAGVPPDTAAAVLAALLAACAERAPGLSVDLREVTTGEQVRLLASGGLDVGLVHRPADTTGLLLGPEVSVDLGVVLPRTSPLARRPEVTLGELAGHDLVLFPRAHAPDRYDQVLDVCRAAGFVPGHVRHASNSEFLLALVTAGHGVAFDPGPVARKEPRVAWRPLSGRPLTQRLSGAWPAGRTAHPAARTFAELAAEVLAGDRAATPHRTDETGPTTGPPRPWSVVYG
ncbi:LysR substrate-binding domain-containing protein, partial [Streptomyces sp. NPDC059466]|uniref:LysR family substrate-binding domain-containing protein n=1 Tax=Streptomyces sp. NPDC059466 TaxID=3346843 RepID=UPI00367FE777